MATCGSYQHIKGHVVSRLPQISQIPGTHFIVHSHILALLTSSTPISHQLITFHPIATYPSHKPANRTIPSSCSSHPIFSVLFPLLLFPFSPITLAVSDLLAKFSGLSFFVLTPPNTPGCSLSHSYNKSCNHTMGQSHQQFRYCPPCIQYLDFRDVKMQGGVCIESLKYSVLID